MRSKNIKVGSRATPLAVAQVKEVFSLLGKRISYTHVLFQTTGDRDKKTPLTANVRDDFFTDRLDRALLSGEVDVTIHSAKDLPQNLQSGLSIFALTEALDETDSFVGPVSLLKLKKGSRVGTSSFLRQESLKALNPNIRMVNIRGSINERIDLVKKGKIDGIIVATCALKRLKLTHLIKNILAFETTPLQGQLAVVGRSDDKKLIKIFESIDVRRKYGKAVLVGAGPGDPGLITLKGIDALKKADVVYYDFLTNKRLLHYAKSAEKVYAGRRKGNHALSQSKLLRMMRSKISRGKNVVRLKGGDPLIFGRGAEELNYFRSFHIDVEVIPGISSATGIPSSLGIPLTARRISSSVAFISGHGEDERRTKPQPIKIPRVDTIVFLMGLTKLKFIIKALVKKRWADDTPVMVISKGTYSDEKSVAGNIRTIERQVLKAKLRQPALIVVGAVVNFGRGKND